MLHSRRLASVLLLLGLVLSLAPSASHPQSVPAPSSAPGHTETLLPDGRWLLLGGEGATGPLGSAAVRDPRSGAVTPLTDALQSPRAWHTATVLPDGTVLVLGGVGAASQTLAAAELFDPATETFQALSGVALTPRSHHTITLLTDGRLLVIGGQTAQGSLVISAEIWNPQTQELVALPAGLTVPREGHTASLLPTGAVLVWGGRGRAGTPLSAGEVFDPERPAFTPIDTILPGPSPSDVPQVEATIPVADAVDVPLDTLIALRFSKPLRAETVTPATVTLAGPAGPLSATVVAAEAGLLVFITPDAPLAAGALYTVSLNGLEDTNGFLVPFTALRFTTTGPPGATVPGAPQTGAEGSGGHGSHQAPGATAGVQAAVELDEWEWRGERRNGKPSSAWQSLPPLQAPRGVTALAGQVLRLTGQPLADVTLQIGYRRTRTDATGRFLLTRIPAGYPELVMDGSTANKPGKTYGTFDIAVDVEAGETNVLPFTIWMPLIDTRHATPVPVPTTTEVVATTPRIPGLEVRVPADVILRMRDGQPLTSITLTRIPVDRPPFPLPEGSDFFFTPQTHGALVESATGDPRPPGVRFIMPNYKDLAPGVRVDLWSYDVSHQWYVYGQGTVTRDGRQIMPDPGVAFHRVTCAFILGPGESVQSPILAGATGGDPVDLATGLFVLKKTDLAVEDVIPIVIERTYRQSDSTFRPFGIGASHFYQMYLTGDLAFYTYADLVLAGGYKVHYVRTSPGTGYADAVMEHTGTPTMFHKSKLTWNTSRPGWDLTFKNGTVFQFTSGNPGSLLVGIRDRVGNQLTISRGLDVHNQRIGRITSPNGRWVEFTYVGPTNNAVAQIKDNSGRIVTYTYDADGTRLIRVTDPAGGLTEYTYDTLTNRMLTLKDARAIVFLTNEYDSAGRISRQTQVDGTTFQFAYTLDQNGKIIQTDVTDPRGNVRRVTFNADGYALSDTQAFGTGVAQATAYTRQSGNFPTSVTDALGRQTDFAYDTMGNLTSLTRLAGTGNAVTTTFTYEPTFNQVASVADPLSHTTNFAYDGLGNLTTITDPLSQQTTLTYNAAGQPLTITTPAGTTTLTYSQGDLASVTDPTGKTTTRFTDALGRLVSLTNPLGQRTRYEYDVLNRLTKTTDMLGGLTQFGYDPNGNLLSLTDPRSSVTSYTYSNMDRVTGRTDPLTRSEGFGYDNNGNQTSFTDRKSQVTSTTYDALDRPTQVTYAGGSTTAYSWDAGNRVTQIVDSISGTITRAYDGLDRLAQEVTPQGTVSYTYDAAGRRTSMTVLGQPTVSYTYDNADRPTQITQGTATVTVAYDTANRRTSLTLPNGVVTESAYDAASRLTGLTYKNGPNVLGTLAYAYDSAGSRTQVGGTWARTGLPQALASATYNAANHQVTFGGQTLAYDLNGNLTSDGTTTYTRDARNRLASLSGGGTSASFQYDPLGRRTRRVINATTTDFLYDGVNPVQELSGGAVLANLLTGLGIDEYLTRTDSAGLRALLTDALGSTVALTDPAATVQTQYTYEPFGSTATSGPTNGNPFQYTGRENDGTGLHYYRARYYHPDLARFISEDPIGFEGRDVNLYAYVGNDPQNWGDPLGLITMPAPGDTPRGGEFGAVRGRRRHQGVDRRSPLGGCIVAADDGVVVKVNPASAGGPGGNEIVVRNRTGSYSVYSHTQPIPGVSVGAAVKEGRPIGRTDISGASTGPHLHYQYKAQGESDYADPMNTQLSDAFPYPTGIMCSGRK